MDIKYRIIKKASDLDCLKETWEKLENGEDMTAFQEFKWNRLLCEQWLSTILNSLFSTICVFELVDGNETKILAPLIIQKSSVGIKWLGRKKGIYFLGIESYSDYMGFVYKDVSYREFDFLVSKIHETFPRLNFYLDYVRDNTKLAEWCNYNNLEDRLTTSVCVNLEDDTESYTKGLSKSTRQNLRTALNRMKKDNFKYELFVLSNIDNANFVEELNSIHAARTRKKNAIKDTDLLHYYSRYLHAEYVELKNKKYNIISNSMRKMTNSVIVVVKLNNDLAGYLYGLRDNKAVRIMQNCFKEEYSFYSPLFRGAYDFILDSIDKKQVKQVDFTRGGESYKFRLGGGKLVLHHYVHKCK